MLVSLLSKGNSGKLRGRVKVSQVDAQAGFGFKSPVLEALEVSLWTRCQFPFPRAVWEGGPVSKEI